MMKKIVTLAFIVLASTQFAFAQTAIARIKYEEAEEAYAANKFELAVTKLTEVEAILKSTNPRVLYLKIMAQYGSFNRNTFDNFEALKSTRILTSKYLKNYENLPDNEDKYRDIYKIAEALKEFPTNETEYKGLQSLYEKKAYDYRYSKDSQDYSKAFKFYNICALNGIAYSMTELGIMYAYGFGTPKNLTLAAKYFKQAADKGNAAAQNYLGVFYYMGLGELNKSEEEAKKYFELSKNQGYSNAFVNLAFICLVKHNYNDGLSYLQQSEQKDNAYAQYGLGLMCRYGWGVKKDKNLAYNYYKSSADKNNARGMMALGGMYEVFIGPIHHTKESEQKSVEYYQLAANQGYPRALRAMGMCFNGQIYYTYIKEKNLTLAAKYDQQYQISKKEYFDLEVILTDLDWRSSLEDQIISH